MALSLKVYGSKVTEVVVTSPGSNYLVGNDITVPKEKIPSANYMDLTSLLSAGTSTYPKDLCSFLSLGYPGL